VKLNDVLIDSLNWGCSGSIGSGTVLCNTNTNANEFECDFGEVYNVTNECTCADPVIVSTATVLAPNAGGALNITCSLLKSNVVIATDSLQIQTSELKTPKLSFDNSSIVYLDIENCNVTVKWNTTDISEDIEYGIIVSSSLNRNYMTGVKETMINLSLHINVNYTIMVYSQRCEGILKSKNSSGLTVSCPVMPMPTDSSESVAPILGGSLAGVLFIVLCGLILAVWHYREKLGCVDSPELHDNIIKFLNIPEVESEETELSQFSIRREEVEVEKRSRVGGLSVDDKYMYYSFTENEDKTFLRKCEHNGTFIYDVSLPKIVRGIGKDNYGFLYVLCSDNNSEVLKFDEELNPVRKTNIHCAEHCGEAYGILVTGEHVFVCARLSQKVCILDLDLNLKYLLKLSFEPIGITKLNDEYFVTARAAIGILDLNFDKMTFTVKICRKMKIGRTNKWFKPRIAFRGICSDNQYLYVTERDRSNGGRVLCLHYQENQFILKYVCPNSCHVCQSEKCCPIVIVHHNGTIIYSQGSWGRKFHILRLAYDGTTAKSEAIIEVV
jgi:hypothetical protein